MVEKIINGFVKIRGVLNGVFKLDFSLGPREAFGLIVKDNPEDDIIAPTHKSEFLNRVFRIINYIVAKLFTKK